MRNIDGEWSEDEAIFIPFSQIKGIFGKIP